MASQQHSEETQSKQRTTGKREETECTECHAKENDLLRDAIEEIRERSDDVKTLVAEYVKDKPFKALGIALVTGMALTFLLKR
jgi:ElaB/YqjD/DUF883 family membrane-anchored ribosome-binding protein